MSEITAKLVWRDGREQSTPDGGAIRIYFPWCEGDRYFETEFVIDERTGIEEGDVWVYRENETRDVTDRVLRAREEIVQRRNRVIRAGLRALRKGAT